MKDSIVNWWITVLWTDPNKYDNDVSYKMPDDNNSS